MKESNSWGYFRVEKEKLEDQIEASNGYINLLNHIERTGPIVVWEDIIDLTKPSFEDQIQSIILGTALKIQRRQRSFFGRLLFSILDFLFSFFSIKSSDKTAHFHELDPDRADLLNAIRSIVSENRESFIRVYKSLLKSARGGRLIDIRKSTRRFTFLRIYSNNIDEESLIAKFNMRIGY